jgi:hypothetical protein
MIGFVSLVRAAPAPAVPRIDRPALETPLKPRVLSVSLHVCLVSGNRHGTASLRALAGVWADAAGEVDA